MNDRSGAPIAQFVDKFLQRTAVAVTLEALAYALTAVSYLVDDETAAILQKLPMLLSLLVLVILLPVFIRFVRLRANKDCDWSEPGGYVAEVFSKACVRAFSATFVLLIVLQVVADKYFAALPTAFFLNVILALSLGVLGLTFFYLVRSDDDELDDDFGGQD